MSVKHSSHKNLLEEVSNWKLEGESEDSSRYFYHSKEVDELESGRKCFVIGRKGTGKTAICTYLLEKREYDCFTTKLSFKEFPFRLLYEKGDVNFTRPSQYISLWKYLIYSSMLKMMSKNENLDREFLRKVREIYPDDPVDQFQKSFFDWTKVSKGIGILGISGQAARDRQISKIEEIWNDLIPVMEDMICQYIDESEYYIVFDELDEDYRNFWDIERRDDYVALITSLFKAVSSIKKLMISYGKYRVKPIVFLRDDIYQLLSDPDSNKWEDDKINLRWSRSELKSMLRWRILRSRADMKISDSHTFEDAMGQLFISDTFKFAGGFKTESIFDHIARLSHERPRDFVRYFRDCARSSIRQNALKISNDTIKGMERDYSNHLRSELVNEISGLLPDISAILDSLASFGKDILTPSNFYDVIFEHRNSTQCHEFTKSLDELTIARLLFHFSIIGNMRRGARLGPIYKYQHEYAVFNKDHSVAIHRGLLKSLGVGFNANSH